MEPTANFANTREDWIDILRGFLMFLVILGHELVSPALDQYLYSFHMPAFFLLSGMLAVYNQETRIGKFLKKKCKSLLLPYVFLNLLSLPLWWMCGQLGLVEKAPVWKAMVGILLSNRLSGYPLPSNPSWFLPCLFLVETLFFFAKKMAGSDKNLVILLPAVTALAYASGTLGHKGGGIWHVETAFTAVEFFLAGYLLIQYRERIGKVLEKKIWFWVLFTGLLACGWCGSLKNGRVSMIGDWYKNLALFYGSALATSLALVLFCFKFGKCRWFARSGVLFQKVGVVTLPYLVFHVNILRIVKHFVPFFGQQSDGARLLLVVLFFVAFLPAAVPIQKIIPGRRKKRTKQGTKQQRPVAVCFPKSRTLTVK